MVDAFGGGRDIGTVNRALPTLAVAAWLVMLLEAAPSGSTLPAGALGLAFVAWSVAGYRWALGRGRLAAVVYVAVALVLGFVVFDVAGPGVGSTLLLVVVVVQAVVLLPLGWAVVVALLVPLVHVGMPMADGLRQVVSTGLACAFAFVLAALHLREQQARSELAVANARLRELRRPGRGAGDDAGAQPGGPGHPRRAGAPPHGGQHAGPGRAGGAGARDPARADACSARRRTRRGRRLTWSASRWRALREPRPARRSRRQLADAGRARARRRACPPSVDVDGSRTPAAATTLQVALYRAAQEGLTNVRKHARAQRRRAPARLPARTR